MVDKLEKYVYESESLLTCIDVRLGFLLQENFGFELIEVVTKT